MYRLPVGPMFWWTDVPAAAFGAPQRVWVLPPWLPQKLYIVGATFGQQEIPDGKPGQFAVGIDRRGLSALNALPPFYQAGGDTQWDQIGDFWTDKNQTATTPEFAYPKILDRVAGDRLWIQNDVQAFGTDPAYRRTLWMRLKYVVDDAWLPPTPIGWASLLGGPMPMEGSLGGWGGYTIAQAFHADWFASGAGTKTRVTIAADHVSSAAIGVRVANTPHQAVSMIPLTFGGGNTWGVADASGRIVSDDMNFGLPSDTGLVVKFRVDSVAGNVQFRETQPSTQSYFKAASDDVANSNGIEYTASVYGVNGIINIEQFY
jgi:hypothetical protein